MRFQSDEEIFRAGKSHPASDELLRFKGFRNGVRLQPVLHLQPVFERTKEVVGVRQFAAFVLRDEAAIGEPAETDERVRHAQPLITPAMGQLKRLRDELDLADSAAAKFHIESALLLDLPIDLLFDQTNAFKCAAHRDVSSEDVRRRGFLELCEKLPGTRCRTRTDQSLAFPVLRRAHVITDGFVERTCERAVTAVWAKSQVDAIRSAFAA